MIQAIKADADALMSKSIESLHAVFARIRTGRASANLLDGLHVSYYGVDTPDRDELIASNHTVEEIREYTGADSLAYLSLDGLKSAVGPRDSEFCYACYTGEYPTDLVGIEQLVTGRRTVDRS